MEMTRCLPLWEGFIEEEAFERGLRGRERGVKESLPQEKGAEWESPVRKADVGQLHQQVLLTFHSQHQCPHLASHSSGFLRWTQWRRRDAGWPENLLKLRSHVLWWKRMDSLPILNSLKYLGFSGWVRGDSLLRRKGVGEAPGSKMPYCLRVHIYFLCMLLTASNRKPN